MIHLQKKSDCVGCEACVQRCPKHCITMHEDTEGFLYPQIDTEKCIDCGLCERVCPVINQGEPRKPLVAYAAKNQDESVRLNSSSGGVFSALAEYVIAQEGVVFGACIDAQGKVYHDFTESCEGIAAFRGSKYVQSRIGNAFWNVEKFLKEGRMVLFSGTPCQVAALYLFLRKGYDKLIAVDFICHGVPSPGVFRCYLSELKDKFISLDQEKKNEYKFKNILFRDKVKGWKDFSFSLEFSKDQFQYRRTFSETLKQNIFLRGFLADLYLRPSCYHCPAKKQKSGSDITIGDFWGIGRTYPQFDDDKGVSAVLINTAKGKSLWLDIINQLETKETTYQVISLGNPALERAAQCPEKRDAFFRNSDLSIASRVKRLCFTRERKNQLKHYVRQILSSVGLLEFIRKIRNKSKYQSI